MVESNSDHEETVRHPYRILKFDLTLSTLFGRNRFTQMNIKVKLCRCGNWWVAAAMCLPLLISCKTTEKAAIVVMTTGAARNVTRLTQTPQDETAPVVSPNGQTVAFQVFKDNQFAPTFSPDGKWLAFSSNLSGNCDVWLMKADGSARTQLTSDKSEDVTPFWGADSNIYFASNKTGNWDIWRLTPVLPE